MPSRKDTGTAGRDGGTDGREGPVPFGAASAVTVAEQPHATALTALGFKGLRGRFSRRICDQGGARQRPCSRSGLSAADRGCQTESMHSATAATTGTVMALPSCL